MEPDKIPKELPTDETDFITTSRAAIFIGLVLLALFSVIHVINTLAHR